MKRACILLLTAFAVTAHGENWPGFRGPGRQGISRETNVPLHWNAESNVVWKVAIPGEAWSSPIVWEDRVFVTTTTENGATCRIVALDRRSGRVLWNVALFEQVPRRKETRNSYATPTPATDGENVYAVFGDGSVAAVDFAGKPVWINREFPYYSQHGLGSSPILNGGLLIMARDASSQGEDRRLGWQKPWDQSFVLALDTKTGSVRWKTMRGMSRIGHITPNLWTNAQGGVEVVSGAGDVVQGFDAATGERLWTSENTGEGVVPSIVIGDGLAFTASGWGGRESTKAFRLGERGDLKESNLVWEQRRGMPRVPSFIYLNSYLFTLHDGGVAACLDAKTGEFIWQERVGGNHSASPVAAEGRIYLTSDDGLTTVIEAGPEFKVLARNPLDGPVQASMAVSQGSFFLRTGTHLYRIGRGR